MLTLVAWRRQVEQQRPVLAVVVPVVWQLEQLAVLVLWRRRQVEGQAVLWWPPVGKHEEVSVPSVMEQVIMALLSRVVPSWSLLRWSLVD